MRVRQDGALRDGVTCPGRSGQSEPVANSVGHGVPVAPDDKPVLVLADDLFELALASLLVRPRARLKIRFPLAVYPTVTEATQRRRALSHERPLSPGCVGWPSGNHRFALKKRVYPHR